RFAAASLLRRRADHTDRKPDVVGHPRRREPGADGGRRDDVVAAGMADAGQAVVLGAEGNVERTRAGAGDERGRQPADAAGDAESGPVEDLRAPPGGVLLLEAELR